MTLIEFKGKEFRVADEIGVMPLMKFAKLAQSGADTVDMGVLAAVYDLIQQCLHDDDWSVFEDHATATRASDEDLMEFVAKVIATFDERPTVRSSDSSDGPQTTEPNSEVISFSEAAERQIAKLNAAGRPDLATVIRKRQEFLTG